MIIARSPLVHRRLQEQFRNRTVQKTYLAIAARNPLERGRISMRSESPIGRHPQYRTRMDVVEER